MYVYYVYIYTYIYIRNPKLKQVTGRGGGTMTILQTEARNSKLKSAMKRPKV